MDESKPEKLEDSTEEEKDSFFKNRERHLRLLKFSIVSSIGLGIDYLIVFLMLLILDISIFPPYFWSSKVLSSPTFLDKILTDSDVLFKIWFLNISKVIIAQAVAILIVMVYNYIINKIWTFREQEKETEFNTVAQFIKFAIVGASGTLINLGLVYLFYDTIGWNEYLAITIGFIVSVITNFILNDIWTFNPKFGKKNEGMTT